MIWSSDSAGDLRDAADGWDVHELVDESLAVHLGEDAPLVVISESAAHGLVVHVWLVLVQPPQPGHGLAVHQLEDALLPVTPLDELGTAVFILKQLVQIIVTRVSFSLEAV